MKKLLCTVMGYLLVFCQLATVLPSYAAQEGDYKYEVLPGDTVEITAYLGDDEELTIPGVLGGHPVTSIGESAFERCRYLESVIIPDSVISIGDFAFEGCWDLESVKLPNGIRSIGEYAFSSCYALSSITIPDSVTDIGEGAFRNCSLAGGVQLSGNIKHISSEAFMDCDLQGITIPEGVQSIGESAFEGCGDLKRVTLPASLTAIEDYAFWNCSSLERIVFPAGVTYIGDGAFRNCDPDIYFEGPPPEGITPWTYYPGGFSTRSTLFYSLDFTDEWTVRGPFEGEEQFWWPDEFPPDEYPYWDGYVIRPYHPFLDDYQYRILTGDTIEIIGYIGAGGDIRIPKTIDGYRVVGIGNDAFLYCDNLTAVHIPDGVISIGNWAFYRCEELASIEFPDSVVKVGEYAFAECFSLTSIILPDGVTHIGEGAFSWCDGLVSITIPSGVTHIGEDAFAYCYDLETVYFRGLPPTFAGSGAFETRNENTILYYPAGLAEYWAPNGETTWNGYHIASDDAAVKIKRGDANCDGIVNAADAAAILRYLVRLETLSDQGLRNALVTDMSGNTKVSAADAAKILRWLVRLEKAL